MKSEPFITVLGHEMLTDYRQATCCDNPGHIWKWGVCSCGWEHNFRYEPVDFSGHRIKVLEDVVSNLLKERNNG
jgi:hypothetical protein